MGKFFFFLIPVCPYLNVIAFAWHRRMLLFPFKKGWIVVLAIEENGFAFPQINRSLPVYAEAWGPSASSEPEQKSFLRYNINMYY